MITFPKESTIADLMVKNRIPDEIYDIACHQDVTDLCQPIMDNFDINCVNYSRFYWNQKCVFLSTSEQWVRYYNHNELLQFSEGFPSLLTHSIVFFDDISRHTEYYQHVIRPLEENFGFYHGVVIIIHRLGYAETILLTAKKEVNLRNIVLNNQAYFEKFIDYFRVNSRHRIKTLKKRALSFDLNSHSCDHSRTLLEVFLNSDPQAKAKEIISQQRKVDFIKASPKRLYLDEPFEDIFITHKQVQIIQYLKNGLTYKQMAKKMSISWTTVRSHIETLKEKFKCHNKKELLDLINKYKILSMLQTTLPVVNLTDLDPDIFNAFQDYLVEAS